MYQLHKYLYKNLRTMTESWLSTLIAGCHTGWFNIYVELCLILQMTRTGVMTLSGLRIGPHRWDLVKIKFLTERKEINNMEIHLMCTIGPTLRYIHLVWLFWICAELIPLIMQSSVMALSNKPCQMKQLVVLLRITSITSRYVVFCIFIFRIANPLTILTQ